MCYFLFELPPASAGVKGINVELALAKEHNLD